MRVVEAEMSGRLGTVRSLDDARADAGQLAGVATSVTDGLNAHDFDVLDPASEGSHYLYVTNARDALSEIIIRRGNGISWEYRPFHGGGLGAVQIAAMTLDILAASNDQVLDEAEQSRPGRPLNIAVGGVLMRYGMHVRRAPTGEVGAMTLTARRAAIIVANPARSDRGRVRVSDNGTIRWECRLSPQSADVPGVDPAEAAATIARALLRAEGR
jgi:hypothetical protein